MTVSEQGVAILVCESDFDGDGISDSQVRGRVWWVWPRGHGGCSQGGVVGVVIIHMYVCITQRQTMRFVGDLTLMYTTHAPEPVRIDVRMYILLLCRTSAKTSTAQQMPVNPVSVQSVGLWVL